MGRGPLWQSPTEPRLMSLAGIKEKDPASSCRQQPHELLGAGCTPAHHKVVQDTETRDDIGRLSRVAQQSYAVAHRDLGGVDPIDQRAELQRGSISRPLAAKPRLPISDTNQP